MNVKDLILAYIVTISGENKGVILVDRENEVEDLLEEIKSVLKIEMDASSIDKIEILGALGDWGEDTYITASYYVKGSTELVECNELVVTKNIIY